MRICSSCKEDLPTSCFHKKRNSFEGYCKNCKELKRKQRLEDNPQLKVDRELKRKLRLSENPDLLLERHKYDAEYYQKNKATRDCHTKDWYRSNPEKRLASHRVWRKSNLARMRYHGNKYRAAKLKATPKWALSEWEEFLVSEIYHLAELRQNTLGKSFHVDHVVPLQSDKVCGLHCSSNLQILLASVNISKNNRYWPDMW